VNPEYIDKSKYPNQPDYYLMDGYDNEFHLSQTSTRYDCERAWYAYDNRLHHDWEGYVYSSQVLGGLAESIKMSNKKNILGDRFLLNFKKLQNKTYPIIPIITIHFYPYILGDSEIIRKDAKLIRYIASSAILPTRYLNDYKHQWTIEDHDSIYDRRTHVNPFYRRGNPIKHNTSFQPFTPL
jgi:hypothetical protein